MCLALAPSCLEHMAYLGSLVHSFIVRSFPPHFLHSSLPGHTTVHLVARRMPQHVALVAPLHIREKPGRRYRQARSQPKSLPFLREHVQGDHHHRRLRPSRHHPKRLHLYLIGMGYSPFPFNVLY